MLDDGSGGDRPRLVKVEQHSEVTDAFSAGAVVALPAVGGYALAVKAGLRAAEAHLNALVTDPDGPHYLVANKDAVRKLTSRWNDDVQGLLERCWPGPLELFLPRAAPDDGTDSEPESHAEPGETADTEPADTEPSDGQPGPTGSWAIVVGTPDGRALRRICKEQGPWRTAPLSYHNAVEVVQAFDASDVALVVDGGERTGEPPTLVDATASPLRVLHEGALPADFVEGAVLMSSRRRGLFRRRRKDAQTS